MKLHFMGKYNLDENSLPATEHKSNAIKFKEANSSKEMAKIGTVLSLVIVFICIAIVAIRTLIFTNDMTIEYWHVIAGLILPSFTLYFHEILHAICFKKDAYIYSNLRQGMMFVIGTEDMSKSRFVFMSLLPNLIFGFIPFILGLIYPNLFGLLIFGMICISMGAGDYYNIFNALTQMPKGARTYLHKFNSYWYIPQK